MSIRAGASRAFQEPFVAVVDAWGRFYHKAGGSERELARELLTSGVSDDRRGM
jgi:hypothetical protein